jgi:hypothetical protein
MTASDNAAKTLQRVKNATLAKKPDEVDEIAGGAGVKDISGWKIGAHGELKSVVAGKNVQVPASGVKETQGEATAGDFEKETVQSPASVQAAVHEPSSNSPVASGTSATGTTDENLPHPDIPDGGQPLMPNAGRPVIHEATGAGEKVRSDASGKRTTNAQDGATTPKFVQKSTGSIGNAIAVGARPNGEKLPESTAPAGTQELAGIVGRQAEISKPTEDFNKAVSEVTRSSTGVSSVAVAVDGQVRKPDASEARARVTDTELPVIAGGDLVAPAKTAVSPEKMAAVAPIGREGQNKPQAKLESSATLLHPMGTGATAVVSGNPSAGLSVTKPLGGDIGFRQTGLPAGSGGRDETAAPSMDEAPRMLTATSTSLEIGVQNGIHGWLKVRAEMTEGGVVNASVSAASSAGQEMLHRELPALTAYLQEEKVAVNAVIVHAPSVSGSDPRSSSAADGAGGETPQRSNQGEEQHQSLRKPALNGSDGAMTYGSLTGVDEDGSLPLAAYVSGGSWLSVRA